MITAAQIMTPGVVTISPEAPLKEAIHTILVRGVSGLPVVDEHHQDCRHHHRVRPCSLSRTTSSFKSSMSTST